MKKKKKRTFKNKTNKQTNKQKRMVMGKGEE
jgi:hypothetical protein